jgi:hypothetical protein
MNVGTGRCGFAHEVIKLVCEAAARSYVVAIEVKWRAGNPTFLCVDASLIKTAIRLTSKYFLEASSSSLY